MSASATMGAHEPAGDALHRVLQVSAERLGAFIEDMSDQEVRARPQGLAPVLWQLGHVAVTDARLANQAGEAVSIPEGWEKLFAMGSSGDGELPPREAVLGFLRDVSERLVRLSQGDLARPIEGPQGRTDPLGYRLAFCLFHRGYHLGKVMTLRALLGKPRLLG